MHSKKSYTLIVLIISALSIAAQEDKYTLRQFDYSPKEYGFVKYKKTTVIPEYYTSAPSIIKVPEQIIEEQWYCIVTPGDAHKFAAEEYIEVKENNNQVTYTFLSNLQKGGYFIIPLQKQSAMAVGIKTIGSYYSSYQSIEPEYAEALCIELDNEPWVEIPKTYDAQVRLVNPLRSGANVSYEGKTIVSTIKEPNYEENKLFVAKYFDTDADIELGSLNGQWVAIVGIGEKKTLYAMYGIWETNEAKKYGFNIGDAVYPTEKIAVEECPTLSGLGITSSKNYGAKCFSYDEILASPQEIYPLLIWREELLTSRGNPLTGETKKYTDTEPRVLKSTAAGNFFPPAPDILDNTNPIPLRNCPDKDYYWELFCECAQEKIGTSAQDGLKPEQFYNYKDFMEVEMMKDGYDYTVYNERGAFSSQVATPETPPAEPYLFNKDCQLLNQGTTPPFMAPWRMGKATLLGHRAGENKFGIEDLLLLGINQLTEKIIWDNMWIKSGVLSKTKDAISRVNANVFPYAGNLNGIKTLSEKSNTEFGEEKAKRYANNVYEVINNNEQNLPVWDTDMKGIETRNEIILIHKTTEANIDGLTKLYVANPFDQNRPFQQDKYFSTFDINMSRFGQPLRTFCFHREERGEFESSVYVQNDKKVWYIQWFWQIITENEFGMPLTYGYLIVLEKLFEEEGELLAPGQTQEFNFMEAESGKPGDFTGLEFWADYYGGTSDAGWPNLNPRGDFTTTVHFLESARRNEFVYIQSPLEKDLPEWASYLKTSKDYHTDQYDISERDESLDKGEALKEIALKIAVSEGLDMIMRGIHYVATEQKDNWVGKAAAAAFETGKRVENTLTHSKTGQIAQQIYGAYIFWKRAMDVCNDLKKTYQSIDDAWDGLVYAIHHLKDYYKNFDITKLRLTNCTSLYPMGLWSMLDWNIYRLQSTLSDHGKAIWAMAYQVDEISKGNYGPLVPVINDVTTELIEAQMAIGEQTDREMEVLENRIDALENGYADNNRERAKLSNMTREAHNLIVCQEWKVRNQATNAFAQALWLTEYEAKDWVKLGAWTKETFGVHKTGRREELAVAVQRAKDQKSALPILMEFDCPEIFSRTRGIHIQEMASE